MASDSVAAKSGFLCMYMSNHPDTLVLYTKHYGKIKGNVASAQMTSIDSRGMTLSYKTKSTGESKDVRMPFNPPLSGYDDVKPRLLEMKTTAEQALGMIPYPRIASYSPNSQYLITLFPMLLLFWLTFAPHVKSHAQIWVLGRYYRSFLQDWMINASLGAVAILHPLEMLYVARLCVRHRTPVLVGAAWILSTLMFGFPSMTDLRRRIQAARIASIEKHI